MSESSVGTCVILLIIGLLCGVFSLGGHPIFHKEVTAEKLNKEWNGEFNNREKNDFVYFSGTITWEWEYIKCEPCGDETHYYYRFGKTTTNRGFTLYSAEYLGHIGDEIQIKGQISRYDWYNQISDEEEFITYIDTYKFRFHFCLISLVLIITCGIIFLLRRYQR